MTLESLRITQRMPYDRTWMHSVCEELTLLAYFLVTAEYFGPTLVHAYQQVRHFVRPATGSGGFVWADSLPSSSAAAFAHSGARVG